MARYRELLKVTARRNDQVNGWFICDRGRFSNLVVNAPDRPRHARVDGTIVSLDVALDTLLARLLAFCTINGSSTLAISGSSRMSQEAAIMAARFRDATGAEVLSFSGTDEHFRMTAEAVALPNRNNTASQDHVRHADLIAVLGCDLMNDAPMMALAIRQARQNGATVYVVDATVPSGSNAQTSSDATLPFEYIPTPSLNAIPFGKATCPVIICGMRHEGIAEILTAVGDNVKCAFILDGPNAYGPAKLGREQGAVSLVKALSGHQVKGIIALESDLAIDLPPETRILAAADWLPTRMIQNAEVVLPVTSWIEMDGTYLNYEGRGQKFKKVMQPGLPIKGLTPELHPPRDIHHRPPGGEMLPTWQIIQELLRRLGAGQDDIPLII
jgi:NADH-quinone oxidoreductase subunit G